MHLSFYLQLTVVVALILLIVASTLRFAWRASRSGPEPLIRASFKELQKGWYQVQLAVANQAPYAVVVDELRRVRPRAARLMAPIKSVSTRKGDFQVWSHPSTDKATASIPLDLRLGPQEARAGAVSRAAEGQVTAWLFLPEESAPAELVLELVFIDQEDHLRRCRVTASREAHSLPQRHAPSSPRRRSAPGL
jgi:hypothetical protein